MLWRAMRARLARAAVAAVLIVLLAVTPLSALIAPGQFEIRFPALSAVDPALTVTLDDRTGLVRGLAIAAVPRALPDAVINYGSDGRLLIVTLDGSSCDHLTELVLERVNSGFVISAKTWESGCSIGTGMTRAVAIILWAPVDASTVDFVPHDSGS